MSKIRSKEIAEQFRGRPCFICGSQNQSAGHHILTVGAHPELANDPSNIICLCFKHHREIHDISLNKFVLKYPKMREELEKRDYAYCNFSERWYKIKE